MNWLVILVLVAVSFKIAAAQDVIPTGSCASINYSDQCCPPLSNCMANDGECTCAATCHRFRDCCSDVACPAGI